jgi:NTE family protein
MIKNKVGLVLSGGGIKGVAHIGAIKALEENNISPYYISGTSAGAIIGAFYAYGYSPENILSFFKKLSLFSVSRYAFRKPGIINTDKFYEDFKVYFPEDDFGALKKKLFVTTVNILNGEIKIFKQNELIKPFLASAAYPGLFSPVKIDNEIYADGGILDNFPLTPLTDFCDHIIGVHTSPLTIIDHNKLKHSYNVLERAIKINFSKSSIEKFNKCDILVNPQELHKFGLFGMNNIYEIYNIGYVETKKKLEEYKEMISA